MLLLQEHDDESFYGISNTLLKQFGESKYQLFRCFIGKLTHTCFIFKVDKKNLILIFDDKELYASDYQMLLSSKILRMNDYDMEQEVFINLCVL